MAEKVCELVKSGGSGGDWKFFTQVTGDTVTTLPTVFKELYIKVSAQAPTVLRSYFFYFIRETLSNTMSTSEMYNYGFDSGTYQTYCVVCCGKDKYQMYNFSDQDATLTAVAVSKIYYR